MQSSPGISWPFVQGPWLVFSVKKLVFFAYTYAGSRQQSTSWIELSIAGCWNAAVTGKGRARSFHSFQSRKGEAPSLSRVCENVLSWPVTFMRAWYFIHLEFFFHPKNFFSVEFLCRSHHVPPLCWDWSDKPFLSAVSLWRSAPNKLPTMRTNCFFPPFLHWSLCPSAPVLKINHHTARHAHDFHMSNKEKERCKTLVHCHVTFRDIHSINVAPLWDAGSGWICIHLCLLLCDVIEGGRGWSYGGQGNQVVTLLGKRRCFALGFVLFCCGRRCSW